MMFGWRCNPLETNVNSCEGKVSLQRLSEACNENVGYNCKRYPVFEGNSRGGNVV